MAKTFVERLEEEQKAILKNLYSDLSRVAYGPSPFLDNLPPPKPPTLRQRARYAWRRLRERVGYWIAGHNPTEDDY